ncbi:hypothetical protein BCR35DRAFT_356410 [Leucosporidium creatinivorum]|uniref:Uncharacterized protein n=1 Tax=Leucosporidium creatinivorum TaxID=106004 RepID=A0A1Y2C460_9BASI|nr:hypothetical protein BCR35DRAFT_356410 [Leucosporidium creatinivorum]
MVLRSFAVACIEMVTEIFVGRIVPGLAGCILASFHHLHIDSYIAQHWMLFAPNRHSFIALVALFTATAFAECFPSDTYHPATDTTVEQCCPQFSAQPENVDCKEDIINGFNSVTCSFPANGNTPYAYRVPVTDAPAQPLYLRLQGGAGESTRLHKGGRGSQINGTMKATPGAIYWVYVGAGGGAADDSGVQSGRGVFWGAGGGYTSVGEGKPNGQDEAASHCFKHASHNSHGDCRMYVAAGGGGAGPASDGDPAGSSKLGLTHNMFGEVPDHGNSGGAGGGYMGGKVWSGHGGGGGAMKLGPGGFTTLYRASSPSTVAFASIRASCSAPLAVLPLAGVPVKEIVLQADAQDGSRVFGLGSSFLKRRGHTIFARDA